MRAETHRRHPDWVSCVILAGFLFSQVIVQEGDTLPLLCERIYRDGAHYPMVARFNGLTDFRSLKPNTVLHFPPLP